MDARRWMLVVGVVAGACGRTGFSSLGSSQGGTGDVTTAVTGNDATSSTSSSMTTVDSSVDSGLSTGWSVTTADPPPPETGVGPVDPPPDVCADVTLAYDDFEGSADAWELGSLWLFSSGVLQGFWMNFDVGCPGYSDAFHLREIDLTTVSSARLEFTQRGESCENDTLRVELTDLDTLETFTVAEPFATPDWARFSADLSAYVGRPRVMVSLGFDNICGDPCGVDWYIDDFTVCGEV